MDKAKRIKQLRANFLSTSLFVAALTLGSGVAHAVEDGALPVGGAVVHGAVGFAQGGSHLDVLQSSDKAVIDWQSFNIGQGASTHFHQPGSNSIAVNRILDANPSAILGRLSADGRVVLLNQNGIVFGPNSVVDVSGLVASTGKIDLDAFVADGSVRLFDVTGGSVVNEGVISVRDAGLAAFVAPHVVNNGVISADLGLVALGTGEVATIDFYGDGLVQFALADGVGEKLIDQSGTVRAERVVLDTGNAEKFVNAAINMDGIIQAGSVSRKGGKIVLGGGQGTVTNVSGSMVAGDAIVATGDEINVSGTADVQAGNSIKFGGDYQGQGETYRADNAHVATGARFTVSEGGEFILWSDGATWFDGIADVSGGLVETSGKDTLGIGSNALVTTGLWLLDPRNVYLRNGSGTNIGTKTNVKPASDDEIIDINTIVTALNAGTSINVLTNSAGSQQGNIYLEGDFNWSGSGRLQLRADNDIVLDGDIISTWGAGAGTQAGFILYAGGDILANNLSNNVTLSSNAGRISMYAMGGDIRLAGSNGHSFTLDTNAMPLRMEAFDDIILGGGGSATSISTPGGWIYSDRFEIYGNNTTVTGGDSVLDIRNLGGFYSEFANRITGNGNGEIKIRQSANGSIQNAINAMDANNIGRAVVKLNNGLYIEDITLDRPVQLVSTDRMGNVTIRGTGTASQVVNVTSANAAIGLRVDNNTDPLSTEQFGVTIDAVAGQNGVVLGANADNFFLSHSVVNVRNGQKGLTSAGTTDNAWISYNVFNADTGADKSLEVNGPNNWNIGQNIFNGSPGSHAIFASDSTGARMTDLKNRNTVNGTLVSVSSQNGGGAFGTLQAAANAAGNNATLTLSAGIFEENLVLNGDKGLTLQGQGDSTVFRPINLTENNGFWNVITVNGDNRNTELFDFRIDGSNIDTSGMGPGDILVGINLFNVEADISNVTIDNFTAPNSYGMYLGNQSGGSDITITNLNMNNVYNGLHVDNISNFDILGSTLVGLGTGVGTGIYIEDSNNADLGGTGNANRSTIEGFGTGLDVEDSDNADIRYADFIDNNVAVNVENSQKVDVEYITTTGVTDASIRLTNISGNSSRIRYNTFNGGEYGVDLNNADDVHMVKLTVNGADVGVRVMGSDEVLVRDSVINNAEYGLLFSGKTNDDIVVQDNTINNSSIAGLLAESGDIDFNGANKFIGGAKGMVFNRLFSGPGTGPLTIRQNDFVNTELTGLSGNFIEFLNGALDNQTVDARDVVFDGIKGRNMNNGQVNATEGEIIDEDDNNSVGDVRVK